MCLLALAPASPLLAPACVAYFLLCQPMLRWNLIFLYRPKVSCRWRNLLSLWYCTAYTYPIIFSLFLSCSLMVEAFDGRLFLTCASSACMSVEFC